MPDDDEVAVGVHGHSGRLLIVRGEGKLASLVIARKKDGESFARDQIRSLLTSREGIPIYQAAAQRFEIAAFETGDHGVYFISDMPQQQNMKLLVAMAPSLKAVLDSPKA